MNADFSLASAAGGFDLAAAAALGVFDASVGAAGAGVYDAAAYDAAMAANAAVLAQAAQAAQVAQAAQAAKETGGTGSIYDTAAVAQTLYDAAASGDASATALAGALGLGAGLWDGTLAAISLANFSATPQGISSSTGRAIYRGVIKSFSEEKGWGHIACDATKAEYGRDIFMMRSALRGSRVSPGDPVAFTVRMGIKGPEADEVQIFWGEKAKRSQDVDSCGGVCSAGTSGNPTKNKTFLGKLQGFAPQRGWGFIACPETWDIFGKDLFVHKREFDTELTDGTMVYFRVEIGFDGRPEAKDCRKFREGMDPATIHKKSDQGQEEGGKKSETERSRRDDRGDRGDRDRGDRRDRSDRDRDRDRDRERDRDDRKRERSRSRNERGGRGESDRGGGGGHKPQEAKLPTMMQMSGSQRT